MNTVGIGGSLRDPELPARLRINQHRRGKENLRVMLDWYYRDAQLYTAPPPCQGPPAAPLCSSPPATPPPHFPTETQDEFVHSFSSLIYWVLGERNEVYGNGAMSGRPRSSICVWVPNLGFFLLLFFFPVQLSLLSPSFFMWLLLYLINDRYLNDNGYLNNNGS